MAWHEAFPFELGCFILMENVTNPISLFASATRGLRAKFLGQP